MADEWDQFKDAPQQRPDFYARNKAYAKPAASYQTKLSPPEEAQFRSWVKTNKVPFEDSPTADYDMRGFFKGLISKDPHAESGVNQNDGKLHFNDYYKTPYHESFSSESQWATKDAPSWNDKDQLVSPTGQIVFDERAKNAQQSSDPWSRFADARAPSNLGTAARIAGSIVPNAVPGIAAAETGLALGTGAVATPIAGLAGLLSSPLYAAGMIDTHPGDVVRNTQDFFTYRPRSDAGKLNVDVTTKPLQLLDKGTNYVGEKTADVTGSPAAGATVKTGLDMIPALLLKGRGKAHAAADTAETRAQAYVRTRTNLAWDSLADKTKKALATIAEDAKNLDGLDAKALERQARLDSQGIPYTRGDVTRDLGQITREETIAKSDAGKPVRDIRTQQDVRLHEIIDNLRKQTGAVADTRQGVGKSVQGAERAKLEDIQAKKRVAYKLAEDLGALSEPVSTAPLRAWLKNPINKRNYPALGSALDDFEKGGKVSVNELEQIRQEATAAAKSGDKGAHYAGEAVGAIDAVLDASENSAYKNARAAHRAEKAEFDRQGAVKKLVSEKGYSTDRAVALEDTFDSIVMKGSAEDIGKVKKSLTEGDTKAKVKGAQAWKDIQGATLDHLKESAAGKRAIVGEGEQLQFSSKFREVFSDLDKDGKIDAIFSPEQAAALRNLYKSVGDVRTKPNAHIAGSDTTPRLVSMLEKIGKLPGGTLISGAAKLGSKVLESGRDVRDARAATRTPLEDSASKAQATIDRRRANRLAIDTRNALLTNERDQ